MNNDASPYERIYLKAWTGLSVGLAIILLALFVFGNPLLLAGKSVWDLLRWLASPLI